MFEWNRKQSRLIGVHLTVSDRSDLENCLVEIHGDGCVSTPKQVTWAGETETSPAAPLGCLLLLWWEGDLDSCLIRHAMSVPS